MPHEDGKLPPPVLLQSRFPPHAKNRRESQAAGIVSISRFSAQLGRMRSFHKSNIGSLAIARCGVLLDSLRHGPPEEMGRTCLFVPKGFCRVANPLLRRSRGLHACLNADYPDNGDSGEFVHPYPARGLPGRDPKIGRPSLPMRRGDEPLFLTAITRFTLRVAGMRLLSCFDPRWRKSVCSGPLTRPAQQPRLGFQNRWEWPARASRAHPFWPPPARFPSNSLGPPLSCGA